MSENKFKTMRHIETVRNFLGECVRELTRRAEAHDQSKLESPEVEFFEEFTPKLRGVTYGSDEYKSMMKQMKPAIEHHNANNRHHPEHFPNGMRGMNLIDLLELSCDWKAASMRHADGNAHRSIDINQARFGYSDDVKALLHNTISWLEGLGVYNKADES